MKGFGRRRRGNEACDFIPQARWEAPENNRVDRKLSLAGRKPLLRSLPAALAGILSVAQQDEALLHTISESHSWPVRTRRLWRVSPLHKKATFSFEKPKRLLAFIQLALQLAELIGRGDGFSSPVRRTKIWKVDFSVWI